MKSNEHPELYSLVDDARLFLLSYKSVIEKAPLQAYHSAIVFSPARSVIRKLFLESSDSADSVSTQVKILPKVEDWNLSVQSCKQKLEGHTGWVGTVAFSKDGLLASGSADHTMRIWDPATGECKQTLTGHSLEPENWKLHSGLSSLSDLQSPLYSLNEMKEWVTQNNRCLLLLPDDYYPTTFAVKNDTLAIADRSGRLTFLEFSLGINFPRI